MSFSAATCLTFNPTIQPSTGPFNIYLDSDYSSTPILTNISLWDLSNNCPYIIQNIPNGTTNLGIKDITNDYCITIPIQDNNICSNCNLGFSNYSATTISKLYCGNLTGSCQTITDYKINWYGPNNTTTLAFTSGKGNVFNYEYTHPFSTLLTSIPVASGVYTPIIENIILSGLSFSNTGGTGNILFSGDCLPTTNISPLTCDVKTNTNTNLFLSAYTNYLSFNSQSQGTPQPITSTYQISASTKYIVWSFKGYNISDRITIYFSGTSYPIIIGLDDFIIGSDLSNNNFNISSYPKSADTSEYFTKYTCLTGLTVNNNDNIIINITPASSNTNWELYMSCLDDYNCNDCLNTQNYKILSSTITGKTQPCNILSVEFKISGCSYLESTSDYISYYLPSYNGVIGNPYYYVTSNNSMINKQSGNLYFNNTFCSQTTAGSLLTTCQTDTTISKYDKTFLIDGTGVFGFTGSSSFISTYYNSIRNSFLGLTPYNSNWSGSSSSSDLSYYRYYWLKIPKLTSPLTCGDGNESFNLFLHHTSPYITGTTGTGDYFLKITANTISKNITFTSCETNCNSNLDSIVNIINVWSTGNTTSYGVIRDFNNGMYYTNPVNFCGYIITGNTPTTGQTFTGYFLTPDWSFNTYPFSGTPSTIIPSLSGNVCNYNSSGVLSNIYNTSYNTQYKYYYQVRLSNPLNVNDFDIWASPISNFSYSGAPGTAQYELAYRYSGGSVTYSNPTYII